MLNVYHDVLLPVTLNIIQMLHGLEEKGGHTQALYLHYAFALCTKYKEMHEDHNQIPFLSKKPILRFT
jgi:hypothetical protein